MYNCAKKSIVTSIKKGFSKVGFREEFGETVHINDMLAMYTCERFNKGCFFVLCIHLVATEIFNSTKKGTSSKEAEKFPYPKKVSSAKKIFFKTSLKKIFDITENFRDLSADDFAFIKELDKQFKVHGGKVKIKVENQNITVSKNIKRTVDGELGYGYVHNGYLYNPPKFMFYPYSQQNIGGSSPNNFLKEDVKTEVSIEPSYSYEINSQSYISHGESQIDVPKVDLQKHTQTHQQYEEPVIVLRIPGPAKYATHLQMLLQKYLEIRAAQYLRILEEAELRNTQQQHQPQQIDYGQGNNENAFTDIENIDQHPLLDNHDYKKQSQQDHHQISLTPHSVQYPEIDNVYHNYKHKHFSQHEQTPVPLQHTHFYYSQQRNIEEQGPPQYVYQPQYVEREQHQYQPEQFPYQQQVHEQPKIYFIHQHDQSQDLPSNTYHQLYVVSMTHQEQADHKYNRAQHDRDRQNQNDNALSLPIAENNPRTSHTKVLFTNKNEQSSQEYQMYQLPSIKPKERHAPTSTPDYHQDFQHKQESSSNYQKHAANSEVVDITQRPYNYHAHGVKDRTRERTAHSRAEEQQHSK